MAKVGVSSDKQALVDLRSLTVDVTKEVQARRFNDTDTSLIYNLSLQKEHDTADTHI